MGNVKPLIAIVGPTAVGKTAVGVDLARRIGGEILSADAVAVYRGLDVGSAKPSLEERAGVRFHLIDVADPNDNFTVAEFARLAGKAVADIRSRNRVPILVGGTGLYVRAVTADLALPNVPPHPDVRARLSEEADVAGTRSLHARLETVDPAAAERIQPADRKRIIRALEVYEVTGRPISDFHTPDGVHGTLRPDTLLFGLTMPRPDLYPRIDARVDAQIADGFLDEVRRLLASGVHPESKSMRSLGYRHLLEHVAEGRELADVLEELKRDTRRYAKRQYSWFNADKNVVWIDIEGRTVREVSSEILSRVEEIQLDKQPGQGTNFNEQIAG